MNRKMEHKLFMQQSHLKMQKNKFFLMWQAICILAHLLFTNSFVMAQNSIEIDKTEITPCPQFRTTNQLPRIDPSGTYIAAIVEGGVQVWSLSTNGVPEKLLWNSLDSLKNCYVITFDWCGKQLLLSVVDSPFPITKELLAGFYSDEGSQALQDFLQLPGRTLIVDVRKYQVVMQLDVAYTVLNGDKNGTLFVAQSPTTNIDDTALNFYEIGNNSIVRKGQCSDLGRAFIFSWDRNSAGVFILSSIKERSSAVKQSLFFVDLGGKKTALLKNNMSLAHPIVFATSSKKFLDLYLYVKYFEQVEALASFDTQGVKEQYRLFDAKSILKDVTNTPQLIAVSPNGRFLFFQNLPVSAVDFNVNQHGDVWVVDIYNKQRRKIIKIGPILQTSAWSQSKLILGVGDSKVEDALQNWVLYCPGAEL